MKLLDKLDRKFGRYAVQNVTLYLIAGQSLFYFLYLTGKLERSATYLSAALLLEGEWWRLATLPFDPPRLSLLFTLFAWYFFYMLGSALEEHWGAFRYNVFLLIGFLMTVAVSFLVPEFPMSNTFIAGSVFLAFAALFPDFEILLFFILPVRIKWLALLVWLGYGYQLLLGGWHVRLMVLAAIANFLIFFARDIFRAIKYGKRQLTKKAGNLTVRHDEPFHRCTICGITDKSHPQMDFRYCPQCAGQYCYCQEHIFSHEHMQNR